MDVYQSFNLDLEDKKRYLWLSIMNIKIKLATNLDESINASTSSEQFFKAWNRRIL